LFSEEQKERENFKKFTQEKKDKILEKWDELKKRRKKRIC
jgi:hypothetical protein